MSTNPTGDDPVQKGPPGTEIRRSSLAPFYEPAFAALWVANVISNIGTWMQSTAAGWLMSELDPKPFTVSLVQVASSLPMVFLAVPAGALADIVDRRKLMILIQIAATVIGFSFARLIQLGEITPNSLLAFILLVTATGALMTPAWQSIVPQLVARPMLQSGIALNSAGINVSRAIGPALAGIVITEWGMDAPFWLNALSNIAVIAALWWWRPAKASGVRDLPTERFLGAIRSSLRYARHSSDLRATGIRAAGFYIFASAYWALLPLVARDQVAGGPALFGILLAAIGLGAVSGAFALSRVSRHFRPDSVVSAGTLGTVVALLLFGFARQSVTAIAASLIAGVSWIFVLATLNISAQVALPDWVRGRGISIFNVVMFGSLTLGSMIWGRVAEYVGLGPAHFAAALGALVALPLLSVWKLPIGAELDLTPSMHWAKPDRASDTQPDDGPVLVMVEYQIEPENSDGFLKAMASIEGERRRDGAFSWYLFEDAAQRGRFIETFMLRSWLEHLRQHERVTTADRIAQESAGRFQVGGVPKVTHLIARRP
jgi:MFS family permease